ncbi:MAG: UPF0280 family protein [Thermodesulfobacteriota bacterium]|nr:UPF0280 family protein [Thermodesulfobacteriota bacterium]
MFENRTYRSQSNKKGLVPFTITVKETDLHIQAESDLSDKAVKSVLLCRSYLESYIKRYPIFLTSMTPVSLISPAPKIAADMIEASKKANVGPMAAVAGAVAEFTCQALLKHSKEVIVENGGDIFMKLEKETVFGIFAGNSPLSMKTGVRLAKRENPFALCTSSGTLGHSKSFGQADAATIVSDSCPLADAVATALGNMVKKESDIEKAINAGKEINGIKGIIIIKGEKIGLWGDLELVRL